jgi:hypothetical protein
MARITDIFDVKYGHSLELNRLKIVSADKGIAFVSRASRNNGIVAHVERLPDIEPAPAGELTCALSGEGGRLSTFLQDRPFYTAYHVARLVPKEPLSKGQMLYYCMCIHANRYRYSFGRQANRTIKNLEIPELDEFPDWLDSAIAEAKTLMAAQLLPLKGIPANNKAQHPKGIGTEMVPLSDLFEVVYGSNLELNALALEPAGVNFVSRTAKNNGVSAKVKPIDGLSPIKGPVLSVAGGGSVLETFLQIEPFYSGRDLYMLRPRTEMTTDELLFYCCCIRANRFRYSYGRQANRTLKGLLVPDKDAIPAWAYGGTYRVIGSIEQDLTQGAA